MKIFILLLGALLSAHAFASAHHFTDIVREAGGWRVYHWSAEPGELQTLVGERSFGSEAEALNYRKSIQRKYPINKSFKFVSTETGTRPLWTVTSSWNAGWEKKYAEWIAKEFDAEFFVRSGLETDCADVAYSLRWIFARNNNLPVAATLAGSGIIATHLTAKTEWENLPGHEVWFKDQRFMAALRWLLGSVYTRTLYGDTYPVKLSRDSVTAGLINLLGFHTEIFRYVSYEAGTVPMEVLYSTVPQAVRVLGSRVFLDTEVTDRDDGGLVKFRWPVKTGNSWGMIPKKEMGDYSDEQYKTDLCPEKKGFAFCLFEKLDISFDGELIAKKLLKDIENSVSSRIQIVNDGYVYCQTNDCTPGTMGYEDWSTPSRDKRLALSFKNSKSIISEISSSSVWDIWLANTEVSIPQPMKMKDFSERLMSGFTSYDPRDTVSQRWADKSESIEKTLNRKKDTAETGRATLIAAAATCRANPDQCRSNRNNFRELSTAEIDHGLITLFGSWMDYASKNKIEVSTGIKHSFFSFWNRSPAPWDPIEERMGNRKSQGHLLNARSILPASGDLIILNNQRIYNPETRETSNLHADDVEVYFDLVTKQYVSSNGSVLRVSDESGNIRATFPLTGFRSKLDLIHNLGGTIFVSERTSTDNKSGWLLDLTTLERSPAVEFHYPNLFEKGIYLRGNAISYTIASEAGKFTIQKLNFPELNLSASRHGRGHQFILNSYGPSGEMESFVLEKSKLNKLQGMPGSFYQQAVTSTFTYFNGFSSTEMGLINIDKHQVDFRVVTLGPVVGSDQRLLFNKKDQELLLMDGDREIPVPVSMPHMKAVSGNSEWFATDSGEVFDYSGGLLYKDPNFSLDNCRRFDQPKFCMGSDHSVITRNYLDKSQEDVSYSYSIVGVNRNFEVENQFVYYPVKRDDVSEIINISGSSGEEDVIFERVESGTGIKVSDSYLLWFPENN